VLQVQSSPYSDVPLDSSSDDGNDDDDNDDDDTNTHALRQLSVANVVGANFLFLFIVTRETATAVMTTMMTTTMTTTRTARTTWTMFPRLSYPCWLQLVTPSLLLLAPLVEIILIRPVVLPILSNQVVTGMLLVAATTLMSCCCHVLTTLCNNVFLLQTPPHI
jgi:hypothetical protein